MPPVAKMTFSLWGSWAGVVSDVGGIEDLVVEVDGVEDEAEEMVDSTAEEAEETVDLTASEAFPTADLAEEDAELVLSVFLTASEAEVTVDLTVSAAFPTAFLTDSTVSEEDVLTAGVVVGVEDPGNGMWLPGI
jgi:hypothetical protein